MEYKSLRDFVKENYKTRSMDYIAISRSIFHLQVRVEVTEFSIILKLVQLFLTFVVANAKYEIGLSHMKKLESKYRSQLGKEPLSPQTKIVMDENP